MIGRRGPEKFGHGGHITKDRRDGTEHFEVAIAFTRYSDDEPDGISSPIDRVVVTDNRDCGTKN